VGKHVGELAMMADVMSGKNAALLENQPFRVMPPDRE
jgi:hypothetical protein